jgi:hypothetical protein
MDTNKISEVLARMSQLFRNYNYMTRAADLDDDAALISSSPTIATDILLGNKYWGGSGSYVDHIFSKSDISAFPSAINPNDQYKALMRELLILLLREGLTRPNFPFMMQILGVNITDI